MADWGILSGGIFLSFALAGIMKLSGWGCMLNYYTARILAKKIGILQFAILFFLAGVLTALPHHLMNR